jgi:hypothetical protein
LNECTKRGCRKLKLLCEDCGRTVSTTRISEEDESEWKDIDRFPPPQDAPCEYKIVVTCKGWYRPNGDEPRFAADDRMAPEGKLYCWRIWKDAPTFDEGVKLVREFREKMSKENQNEK